MVIDYTITVGNIIEIGSILGGGVLVLLTLKADVSALKADGRAMREDFGEMQTEIKKIGEVLITQADQNRRIMHLEDDLRELRHGRGWVTGPHGIDREYTG